MKIFPTNCRECINCIVWNNGRAKKYYCICGTGSKPIRPTIDWCGCTLCELKKGE